MHRVQRRFEQLVRRAARFAGQPHRLASLGQIAIRTQLLEQLPARPGHQVPAQKRLDLGELQHVQRMVFHPGLSSNSSGDGITPGETRPDGQSFEWHRLPAHESGSNNSSPLPTEKKERELHARPEPLNPRPGC